MTIAKQPAVTGRGQGRENQIQFLRFLAFMNVFICHAERWLFFPYRTSHCGTAAVSFFFVLSGVTAGLSLAGKTVDPGIRSVSSFLWKKVRKIYPLYFLTTMFAVIFSGIPELLMHSDFAGLRPGLIQLGKNLLLIQSWFPEGGHSFNTVGWFLSSLFFLYALTLPFGWLLNKLSGSRFRYLLLPGLFAGIFCCAVVYCYTTQNLDMYFWHYQFPPARAFEYLLGMMLGWGTRWAKERIPRGKLWSAMFTVLEAGALLFWYYSLSRPGNYWRNNIIAWIIPDLLVLAVFLAGQGCLSGLFRRKGLVYLGDISFECYLIHQLILIRFGVNLSGTAASTAGNVFVFLFGLVYSLLLAVFIHGRAAGSGRK